MTKQESLIQIATRHQVFLERRKSGVFNEIVPSIEELQSRILTALRELNVDTLDELSKRQFASFIREISAIQQETYANVQSDLLDSADELALSEADFERRTLVLATDSNIALPVRKALLRQIRQRPITATGDLLEPFIKNWSDSQTRKVNGIMRRGFSEGWTNQQMVTAIRGTKRLNFSDGVIKIITRQANAVVRTAIQHSASTARLQLWEENKDVVKKYEWVSTLDFSTTQICRSLDGRQYELGKGPVPPIHNGCRSTTTAVLSSKFDFLDEGATRSSAVGPVSSELTYYDWLKKQPVAFQNAAIGKKRATLLRKGGLSADKFAKLNLNRNFEPLTLEEMKRIEPLAFESAGL